MKSLSPWDKMNLEGRLVNDQQYRSAAASLLDRDAPDVVMEVILVCGMEPVNESTNGVMFTGEWIDWMGSIERYLIERYGYKPDTKLTTVVIEIITKRMHDEQQRAQK